MTQMCKLLLIPVRVTLKVECTEKIVMSKCNAGAALMSRRHLVFIPRSHYQRVWAIVVVGYFDFLSILTSKNTAVAPTMNRRNCFKVNRPTNMKVTLTPLFLRSAHIS